MKTFKPDGVTVCCEGDHLCPRCKANPITTAKIVDGVAPDPYARDLAAYRAAQAAEDAERDQ